MGKRVAQIILKTDERDVRLELGRETSALAQRPDEPSRDRDRGREDGQCCDLHDNVVLVPREIDGQEDQVPGDMRRQQAERRREAEDVDKAGHEAETYRKSGVLECWHRPAWLAIRGRLHYWARGLGIDLLTASGSTTGNIEMGLKEKREFSPVKAAPPVKAPWPIHSSGFATATATRWSRSTRR